MVQIVKDSQLHVRLDAVDERHAPVTQSEDDGVLVGNVGRPQQLAGRRFDVEPTAVPNERCAPMRHGLPLS